MIAGLILAAGTSSRMGVPKQLLDWGGVPLVRHIATAALQSRLDALSVVVGAEAEQVARALEGLPLRLVENPAFATGLASSLRAGIAALSPETEGLVVLLGDQPLVTAGLIDRLIDAAQTGDALISAPLIGGRRANPVLFKAALFPELLAVQGDQGARAVVEAHRDRLCLVPADEPVAADVDTPEDYQRLRAQHRIP